MLIQNTATRKHLVLEGTENEEKICAELLSLSSDGSNILIIFKPEEWELFESRCDGNHFSSFITSLRTRAGNECLTYTEPQKVAGTDIAINLYNRPD